MSSFDKIKDVNLAELDSVHGDSQPEETADQIQEEQEAQPSQELTEEVAADQEEKTEEAQKMMEPQGRHYYIDAEFTDKHMISFVVNHTYRSPFMIIMTIIGIIFPIYAMINGNGNRIFNIACLLIFAAFIPYSTYMRGKSSKSANPAYQEVFHYMVDEWGLHLEINKDAVDVSWDRIIRMVWLKEIVVLYTGKNNAFLIPYECMGSQQDEIKDFIRNKGK